ncbi:tetratricopeptide repeat protein 19, mitochondrial-like [Mercenaria mercenaria]|uniref:tetratricopeptide repeat protein 19, mitochondrial-like n=1 Tax=Mercenaria mercenaria TaxID=6596 RepID=UPI00234FA812|nr:tetratricopeptide repeat protein 19, mitochondrial-like [Mercenaria mercenaria]
MAATTVLKFTKIYFRMKPYISFANTTCKCIFWSSRFTSDLGKLPKLLPKHTKKSYQLRTVALGPALAFLGFGMKKQEEMSEKDQVRQIVSKGIVAKQNGNIAEASKAFHEALTRSTDFLNDKKITKDDHLNHRVFIYDQIANLSMEMGDLKTAELVFKDTMKLALSLGMSENDNAMIEMSLKLATIYLYSGRTDLAVQGLKHCITEQETKLGEKPAAGSDNKPADTAKIKEEEDNTKVLLGKALKHLANYHLQQRDFKAAESLMLKSLEISRSTLGSNDDNTFVIMNDIATCQIMLQEYEKAESLLNEGIKLSGKAQSLMQSAFLSNLGALYIRTKRFSEAQTACERGLKVAERGNDDYLKAPCKACLERLAQLKDSQQK